MLYISVKDHETKPVLRFEIEDYYDNMRRQTYTDAYFESSELEEMLADTRNLTRMGFSLALGFLSQRSLRDRHGNAWAQVVYRSVYKDERKSEYNFDIDEEPYRINPQRRHCTSIDLPTLELHDLGDDFLIKVAKTTLSCLL